MFCATLPNHVFELSRFRLINALSCFLSPLMAVHAILCETESVLGPFQLEFSKGDCGLIALLTAKIGNYVDSPYYALLHAIDISLYGRLCPNVTQVKHPVTTEDGVFFKAPYAPIGSSRFFFVG